MLVGAVAAGQQRRIRQAVVLKTLGATRRRILLSHLVEYAILAAATAFIAGILGTIAAAIVVTGIMDLPFAFSLAAVLQALGLALCLVLTFGIAGSWRVLSAPTASHLKSE